MKTRLHGTAAIPLCSADEERMPDQAQQGKKASWKTRGICASVYVCWIVHECIGICVYQDTEFCLKRECSLPSGQICTFKGNFYCNYVAPYDIKVVQCVIDILCWTPECYMYKSSGDTEMSRTCFGVFYCCHWDFIFCSLDTTATEKWLLSKSLVDLPWSLTLIEENFGKCNNQSNFSYTRKTCQ